MIRKNYIIYIIYILMIPGLLSCGSGGGGGGSGSSSSADTGGVAILFTDSPAGSFSEINITIDKIELLSQDSRATVFSGIKTVNLLDLKNEINLFSVAHNVPAGTYQKIRLSVISVKLVELNGNVIPPSKVKLPSGKIDLNPRQAFTIQPGELVAIQLDMDANKSIHVVANSNKYIVRPVVFINIFTNITKGKIIRVKGTVRSIDSVENTFQLCPDTSDNASYTNSGSACCITIYADNNTSFFAAAVQGNQVSFSGLSEGDPVTVIGTRVIKTSGGGDTCSMGLDAIVVEIGQFNKYIGTITSGPDIINQFDFILDPFGPVQLTAPVKVQIQQGTKIYSDSGVPLDKNAVKVNRTAEIDGILLLDPDPDILNSAFISIDTDAASEIMLSGKVANIKYIQRTFDLTDGPVTKCIDVPAGAKIFKITESGGTLTSRLIVFAELNNNDQVDVYGYGYDTLSGCFLPETIIAFESL